MAGHAEKPSVMASGNALGTDAPFDRHGLFRRALPFAVVAILAVASLGLPPGPKSLTDTLIAVALLVVSAAAIFLPWDRVPSALTIVVPLTYTASVLMLILATGSASSGVGIVVLAPLIWTALYHRRWESAVVVVAVVGVEVVTALTPVIQPDAVILRRVVFWTLLAGLLSVAAQSLRDDVRDHEEAREEVLRRMVALERAAEELTAILDPDEVVATATRLAARLVSPPGTPGRRAQYCRVDHDRVTLVAQYDETGFNITAPFALADHPNLLSVYLSRQALSAELNAETAGPIVRETIERLGVSHSVYVPVVRDNEIDGILAVSVRGGTVSPELFEQCKALGQLLDLALANAQAHRELDRQATTDPLTGLPNRRGFERSVANQPGRRPFVVLVLDVDGLKRVNDTLGHEAGDAQLVRVAQAVQGTMRQGDVLARVGGDEFAAYLFDADEADGRRVAQRVLDALRMADGAVSVSVGMAVGAPDDDVHEVRSAADALMYESKRAGGRRYRVGGPPSARRG
jgi:diguanylate cyclase (GGDEF)-like protein